MVNKKSVVYLKPKGDNNSNSSNEKDAKDSVESATPSTNNNPSPPVGTGANVDESVLTSELKALRQSSIAMSASQKEGATQIIKDWMDDGSPQDTNSETEGEE